MLERRDVQTYDGESYVLQGISLKAKESSVVALMGRNGMGKTTNIRTITGFNPPRRGAITFNGKTIISKGQIAYESPMDELISSEEIKARYLGVT